MDFEDPLSRNAAMQRANQAKLDRIAIMSLNFDGMLKIEGQQDAARTIDIMDLPQMMADRYGVRRVELQHAHFASTEPGYLKEFRDRVAKARSQLIQINLEFGGSNISAGGFSARLQAIDLTKQWIDHAEALGCPRVMVNQGSLAPEVRQHAIDALKIMGEYGKAHKVSVTMENRDTGAAPASPPPATPPPVVAVAPGGAGRGGGGRGGAAGPPPPPATWQVVVEVIKAAGVSANPDIGNFPNEAERAAGLRAMYPLSSGSSHCHYDPEKYDFANAIRISKEVGYKGLYSIETASNNGPDPHAATKLILDELMRTI
jgi:hypothetical protein